MGYLGPAGSYSHEAALRVGDKYSLIAYPSLSALWQDLQSGHLAAGIFPVENSIEGTVGQVMDLFVQPGRLNIQREIVLPIYHCLLAKTMRQMGEIERVVSHFQALAQCSRFLEQHLPGAQWVETSSTAQAARQVAESDRPWAAVAGPFAARLYQLEVLVDNISDAPDNYTRFWLAGPGELEKGEKCKTTLVFQVANRPGALYSVLREFAWRGINLTFITSRRVRSNPEDYMFFVDFWGNKDDPVIAGVLRAVERRSTFFACLGSYIADGEPEQVLLDPPSVADLLAQCRREIDTIDSQVVRLLGMRTRLVQQIGELKSGLGWIRDSKREAEVLRQVCEQARQEGVDENMVMQIYRLLMEQFVDMQAKMLAQEKQAH